jgi:DNA-binding response OmpR family regulator
LIDRALRESQSLLTVRRQSFIYAYTQRDQRRQKPGAAVSERWRFGRFLVDTRAGELRRDGTVVPLQDLPFRLLSALLEHPGEVVTRAELTARLWGTETFVDSTAGLNTAVAKLREAVGDQAEQPITSRRFRNADTDSSAL